MKLSIKYLCISILASLLILGCEKITDFGYNANLNGTVKNQHGDIVSGNLISSDLVIRALGELDLTPIDMRVKGDGTYQNTKLYPQVYSVWLEGAFIESPTQKISIDLTGNNTASHDFLITPFIDCSTPELVGSPSTSTLSVSYSVSGNGGHVPEICVIYCSTIKYPSAQAGSGPGYTTLKKTISNVLDNSILEGTVDFSALQSGMKYYVRVGCKAKGESLYNYSFQITVSIP